MKTVFQYKKEHWATLEEFKEWFESVHDSKNTVILPEYSEGEDVFSVAIKWCTVTQVYIHGMIYIVSLFESGIDSGQAQSPIYPETIIQHA